MSQKSEDVEKFLKKLKHSRKDDVLELRGIILGANKLITEQIKWNAPSFCFAGDDRITFRLQPKDRVDLIFHRGAKVKSTKGFKFDDPSKLVEWLAPDRGVISFDDSDAIAKSKTKLKKLTNAWLKATAD